MKISQKYWETESTKNTWNNRGGGPTPFLPMGKMYMEREGKVFISLSFHILFPMGKNGKRHIFPIGKNRVGPPPPQ